MMIKEKVIILRNNYSSKKNYYNFKAFDKYLHENKVFYKFKKNSKSKILVTDFVSTPGYVHTVGVIGKYLAKIIGSEIDGFIREGDFRGRKILESFGSNKIYNLKQFSLLMTFSSFLNAARLFLKVNTIEDFTKIKLGKVNIGLIVYDHILRHTGNGTFDKFNFKYLYYLTIAINVNKICKDIFKNKYKYAVICELQFIPNAIIFENALVNKCKVVCHEGGMDKFSLRVYRNYKERFQHKIKFSNDVFKKLLKHKKNNIYKNKGNKLIKKKMKFNQSIQNDADTKKLKINRKIICKSYNLNPNKPLVGIFAHDFVDGNFLNSGMLFRDKYSWFIKTLIFAKKYNNVNWLIKDHPTDHTKKPKLLAKSAYNNLCKNNENIKFLSNEIKSKHLLTSIDLALTCTGSVGMESSCFGIKSVIASNTYYSGFGFINPLKNKNLYFKEIENILKNRSFKISNQKIKKANIYAYLLYDLGMNKCPIIPNFDQHRKRFDEERFWKDSVKLIKKYDVKNDMFLKKLTHQIDKNHRHMLNYF